MERSILFAFAALSFFPSFAQDSTVVVVTTDTIATEQIPGDSLEVFVEEAKREKKYDTIYVADVSRVTVILLDEGVTATSLVIGTKDYIGKIENRNTILLKPNVANPTTVASLFFRYGDTYYRGRIAYKPDLSEEDEVIDMRTKLDVEKKQDEKPEVNPFSRKRVADILQVQRKLGLLEGRDKDRIKTIAHVSDKMIFKIAEIMQDDDYLYLKFRLFNGSKIDYVLDGVVDFLYRNTSDQNDYHQVQMNDVISNGVKEVAAKSDAALIYAFPKFTITSKWELRTTIRENGGSRRMELVIPYDRINEATKF